MRALKKEIGKTISQSYLSQIESGARPHLTNSTRMLLARFFKVHPGYLVDDPEGFQTELISDLGALEDKLDLWLISGAERFRRDVDCTRRCWTVARHKDSRMCLVLLARFSKIQDWRSGCFKCLKPPAEERRGGKESCRMNWSDFYLICFIVGFDLQRHLVSGGKRPPALAAFPFSRGGAPRTRGRRQAGEA